MAGELRITGGTFARRRIKVPPAADRGTLRPTSDKVRAAVMNAVGSSVGGARVLDVFAGSGALGIEALSRGASRATFVEKDRRSARVIEENLAALGASGCAEVLADDVVRAVERQRPESFDLVLADPPYALSLDAVLPALARVLAPGGLLVLERDRRSVDQAPAHLALIRDRLYGDTRVLIYAKAVDGASPPADS